MPYTSPVETYRAIPCRKRQFFRGYMASLTYQVLAVCRAFIHAGLRIGMNNSFYGANHKQHGKSGYIGCMKPGGLLQRNTADSQQESYQRDRKILGYYLKAENTQEMIADKVGVPRRTISDVIKSLGENSQMRIFAKEWNIQSEALADAEMRIGELLREIPRTSLRSEDQRRNVGSEKTLPEGISWNQSSQFQKMAELKDVKGG